MTAETVVIDLGMERGEPEAYASPARSTVPGWFAPILVAVLVLAGASASAGPPRPALTPVLSLTIGAADPYTLTGDGELLVQSLGTLGSYGLADGARRWETVSDTPTYRLNTGGGLLLLRSISTTGRTMSSTRAVSLADGNSQWRRPGSIVTVTGSPTLLSVSSVRSFSGEGRRVQNAVEAVDPVTGATRWHVPVPSTAVLLGVPGIGDQGARMLLVHDNRTAAVHDMVTGARLAAGNLPPADYGPDNPVIIDGLLMLRHPTPEGRMVSAFDATTLEPRWSQPARYAFGITACGPYACLSGPGGVRAIDPADGRQRWFQPGWRKVEKRGNLLVAFGTPEGENEPIGLVDPLTGAPGTDLRGWRPVLGDGGDHLLVTRVVEGGSRTMVAVAAPSTAQPRLLADLPVGTGDCRTVPGRLACRSTSGELTVWAYQREE